MWIHITTGYFTHTSVYDKDTIVQIEAAVLIHLLATIKTFTFVNCDMIILQGDC